MVIKCILLALFIDVAIKKFLSFFCLRNESEVGQAIKQSGINREDIFVVTKLWSGAHGYDQCLQAFNESLGK